MNLTFIKSTDSPRLLLMFAGWSAQAEWFDNVAPEGYDLAVVTDYRDETLDHTLSAHLGRYGEICVVAWSFGVPAAARFIASHPTLPVTRRVAVNGTLHPVDDTKGIPTAIFQATLSALSPATLVKFDRRMCGRRADLTRSRSISQLADELRAIHAAGDAADLHHVWDTVIVGDSDAIIPTANQLNAWSRAGLTPQVIASHHMPDFATLIRRLVVDKSLVARRFGNSVTTYSDNATAQRHIARRLWETAAPFAATRPPRSILEIGVGTGLLTRQYLPVIAADTRLTLCDISHIAHDLPGDHKIGDAETLVASMPDESVDMMLGASVIQWFNSPLRFLSQVARVLSQGATAVFSTFAPDNFPELRPMMSHTLSVPSVTELRHTLEQHDVDFDISEESVTLTFDSPRSLLAHLRATGVNGLTADPAEAAVTARRILRQAPTSLTYRPLYLRITRRDRRR